MKTLSRRKDSGRGFSLAEVLVAIGILGSGVTMMLGMFPASVIGISDARNVHLATTLAQSKLEYWMQQGYSTIVSEPATIESSSITIGGKELQNQSSSAYNQFQKFSYQVTHSTVVSGGEEQLDVLVTWNQHSLAGGNPILKTVHLTAWVASQ